MRLLHTKDLVFEEFFDEEIPDYAILSHRWISKQEVSYEDFVNNRKRDTSGYEKILWFAELALSKDFAWCWIDTCCIDKRSSAELSEAINSMYKWYKQSKICVAYLHDVECGIQGSEWFQRGWTLQELLAPGTIEFYDPTKTFLGTRQSLYEQIQAVTGIQCQYLAEGPNWKKMDILLASVARRMSWASKRKTTRLEDIAYCLLGIFEVNMPILYGEGRKSFLRLQYEIIKESSDESIFAWTRNFYVLGTVSMFADSPAAFALSADICSIRSIDSRKSPLRLPYFMTNQGLEMRLPLPLEILHVTDTNRQSPLSLLLLQLDCCKLPSDEDEKRLASSGDCYLECVFVLLERNLIEGGTWARVGIPDLIFRITNLSNEPMHLTDRQPVEQKTASVRILRPRSYGSTPLWDYKYYHEPKRALKLPVYRRIRLEDLGIYPKHQYIVLSDERSLPWETMCQHFTGVPVLWPS